MAKAVFICHTSREAPLARTMCAELEARGIFCWIAPRDVPLGLGYGGAIVDALAACKLVVIIFSDAANASPQVLREIERAVHHRRDLLPFRVAPVNPSKDLEYFISAYQWFDAFPGPPETHLGRFGDSVAELLEARRAAAPIVPLAPDLSSIPPDLPLSSPDPTLLPRVVDAPRSPRRIRRALVLGGGVLAFLAVATAIGLKWMDGSHRLDKPGVVLKAPVDGANFVRPTLMLEWAPAESLEPQNLSFELQAWTDRTSPTMIRLTRDSCVLDGMEGLIHWQVRPIWRHPDGHETSGAWSQPSSCIYYRDALSRLVHTRTLHVGIAEADGIFVVDDTARITGAEIELLQAVANRIVRGSVPGNAGDVNIVCHAAVWGDKFFHLLSDESIDLLASGISISAEREKLYGLAFTRRTFEYPQTLIIHAGTATVDAHGKLALQALGVVDHTTNLTMAQALAGSEGADRLRLYEGSGSYFRMINDLAGGALDGVLMDQPYALKYLTDLKRHQSAGDLTTEDVTARLAPGRSPEQIGFALRRSDTALRNAINQQLDALEPLKQELIQHYVFRPPQATASPPAALPSASVDASGQP